MIFYELVLRRKESIANCTEWCDLFCANFFTDRELRNGYKLYKDYYDRHKSEFDLCLLVNKMDTDLGFISTCDDFCEELDF